jgi:beta-lactamase superfamily II metal-dependent hydrolase
MRRGEAAIGSRRFRSGYLLASPSWVVLAVAALAVAPAFASVAQPAPPPAAQSLAPAAGTFVVHAIDVGTGLSIFIEGHDFALLYDAGSRDDHAGGSNNRVLAYLRRVRPDLTIIDHLILSHPHQDHHEMMASVLAAYQVNQVWDSGSLGDVCGYRAFLTAVAAEPEVTYHDALGGPGTRRVSFNHARTCRPRSRRPVVVNVPRGDQIIPPMSVPLGASARMVILHANGQAPASDLNRASVVVRVDLGGRRVLLMGDAEAGERRAPSNAPAAGSIEGRLLADHAADLRADILIVGHHGSMTSSRASFLDAVGASQFVISSGPFPYQSHILPDPEIRDELVERGSVWRTDTDDASCRTNRHRVGLDAGNGPGGCDSVRIVIEADGEIAPSYNRLSD